MEELLTVEAVAKQFNVSPRTVVRLVQARQLKALRVGRQWRFKQEWVEAWVERNTTRTQEESA